MGREGAFGDGQERPWGAGRGAELTSREAGRSWPWSRVASGPW